MAGDRKAGADACDRGLAFNGDALWGETIFFNNAALLKQIDAQIEIPTPAGPMKPAAFSLDDSPLVGHGKAFE